MRSASDRLGVPRLNVLFEDDSIVVVDKPAGRIVHPAPGHEEGSVAEELVRSRPEMACVGSRERPGVVHRLDIETSGVMVFAKTQKAYRELRRQFESHQGVEKRYLAVVHGAPKTRTGTCESPVGRERLHAVTHWEVLARKGPVALVEFTIETGRMHQIRIHAAELGCPVVGDRLYGDAVRDRRLAHRPGRLLLHAVEISFVHPGTGRRATFASPPPPDIVYAV